MNEMSVPPAQVTTTSPFGWSAMLTVGAATGGVVSRTEASPPKVMSELVRLT